MAENDWAGDPLPNSHSTGDATSIAPEFNKLLAAVIALRNGLSKPTAIGQSLIAAVNAASARTAIGAGTSNFTSSDALNTIGGKIWTGTQSQYSAIAAPDSGTLYIVTAPTPKIYTGSTLVTTTSSGGTGSTSDVGAAYVVRKRPTLISGLTAGADNTATINTALANAQPYDTLKLPPGTWTHSGLIKMPSSINNVTFDGYGATLVGTVPRYGGFRVEAASSTILGLKHRIDWGSATPTRGNGENNDDCPVSVFDTTNVTLQDCVSIGSRDAAIFIYNVVGATIRNVYGRDSMADGLHFSGGARNVVAQGVKMVNPGDDGCAVVSYTPDAVACQNIRVHDIDVINGDARGVSIVGGTDLHFSGFKVQRSRGSGVYIAHEQGDFNTSPVTNASVTDGYVYDGNWDNSLDTGGIGVVNLVSGTVMTDVTVAGVILQDSRKASGQYAKIGSSGGGGGRMKKVLLQDITFQGGSGRGAVYADGNTNTTINVGQYVYQSVTGPGVTTTAEGYTVSGGGTQLAASDTTPQAPGFTANRIRLGGTWGTN